MLPLLVNFIKAGLGARAEIKKGNERSTSNRATVTLREERAAASVGWKGVRWWW